MSTSSLMDAIRVAKENERNATESYAGAAQKARNPFARELFVKLSKFEKYHLEMLTALERSLQESGKYIQYEAQGFPRPPSFEITAAKKPDQKSDIHIITEARELEEQMQKGYASLAAQAPDGPGKDMFNRMAEEEHKHWLILNNAWWSLNDNGEWKWTRPGSDPA
jgi:rubrerythrin